MEIDLVGVKEGSREIHATVREATQQAERAADELMVEAQKSILRFGGDLIEAARVLCTAVENLPKSIVEVLDGLTVHFEGDITVTRKSTPAAKEQ